MMLKSGMVYSAKEDGKLLGVIRITEWPQCRNGRDKAQEAHCLAHFCEYVDERKQVVYLETDVPRIFGLYERFGSTVVEEEPVFSVSNWFMWRPTVNSKRTQRELENLKSILEESNGGNIVSLEENKAIVRRMYEIVSYLQIFITFVFEFLTEVWLINMVQGD